MSAEDVQKAVTAKVDSATSDEIAELIEKAKESTLLAVGIYNNPKVTFRSGAYIVLMIIAWNALLQAIFRKTGVEFFEKDASGTVIMVNGQKRAWPIEKCVATYFIVDIDPIRKNLELMIKLRNELEHRFLPQIDEKLFGECQALLLNFEKVLQKEFPDMALEQNVSFAIQFSGQLMPEQKKALSEKFGHDLTSVMNHIKDFEKELPKKVTESPEYSFKLFLVPKIGNNCSKDCIPVQFVKYDMLKPEEKLQYDQLVSVLTKEKVIETVVEKEKIVEKVVEKDRPVASLELYPYAVSDIVRLAGQKTGKAFDSKRHLSLCYENGIRPYFASDDLAKCDKRYCIYDPAHCDYLFSKEWLNFVVNKLNK